ncbi:MAG: glycosyltransferase, partial [Desulfuromonadales bacterium]|nr:glycosyltransferase [Desulfuromonadales bacterium]
LDLAIFDPLILFMLRSNGRLPEILQKLHVPYNRLNMFWRSIPFESFYIAYLLNKMRVDILHVHHIPLYLRVAKAVRLSRVKGVIFTEHAKFSIEKSKRLQDGCRQAAQQADFLTTVSDDLKDYFVQGLNIAASSVQVILNGVNVKRFNPDNKSFLLREMLPVDFAGQILIHVGRLAEAKDHKSLLVAIKTIVQNGHDIILFLVGDGELRPAIEQQIEDLELSKHVKMLGMRSDVDKLLLGADVFVMSSKGKVSQWF